MKYVAIINMTGYLPESDPVRFDTAGEAWEYLADEAQRDEDAAWVPDNEDDQSGPASLHPAILKMQTNARTSNNLSVIGHVMFARYVYGVEVAEPSIAIGERGPVRVTQPDRPGNGTSRRWFRDINGKRFSFTHVTMPSGEIRWSVTVYNGYGDTGSPESRAIGMRFGCAWSPHREWTFRPAQQAATPHIAMGQTIGQGSVVAFALIPAQPRRVAIVARVSGAVHPWVAAVVTVDADGAPIGDEWAFGRHCATYRNALARMVEIADQ